MISNTIKNVVTQYRKHMAEAKWTFLKSISQSYKAGAISKEERAYAMSHLNPAHITTQDAGLISACSIGASFRILIPQLIVEKSYMRRFSVAPGMNDKLIDGRFIKSLGYRVPEVISSTPPPQK